jgi:hypothetical protein
MTISVSALPSSRPPRNRIVLTMPGGNLADAISVWRNDPDGRRLLRTQPRSGFDQRTILDYECPCGVPVTYGWEATYVVGGGSVSFSEESAAVALTPQEAWLIHPGLPALSFPLSRWGSRFASLVSIGDVTNAGVAVRHDIIGSDKPIMVITGDRQADATSIGIRTYSLEASRALKLLLKSQFPLYVNIPEAWEPDFTVGFYQFEDVTRATLAGKGGDVRRSFTVPIFEVQSPVTSVQNWTYADVRATYANYAALKAAYADYSALATDTRS